MIKEFIGLKSKMYSISLDNERNSKKAKGVKKNVIRNGITRQDYYDVLHESKVMHHRMKTIAPIAIKYPVMKSIKSPFLLLMIKDTS